MNVRVGASKPPQDVRQSVPGSQGSATCLLAAALRAHPYPLFLEPGGSPRVHTMFARTPRER